MEDLRIYGLFFLRNVVPVRKVTRLLELPWASQRFLHVLENVGKFLHKKQKVG